MTLKVVERSSDLKEIFVRNPEHVNTEYTHSVKVRNEPIYIEAKCAGNPEVMEFLKEHLVTIVTPDSFSNIQNSTKDRVMKTLQSCYENGRVLEASKNIVFDDINYEVILKGVGSTSYTRETGAINPWMTIDGYTQGEEEKESLKEFAFYENSGISTKEQALVELERSKLLTQMGVDTEKVLAIYELDEVLGKNGEYISIQKLEDSDVITPGQNPVILVRAHKTNFRLLDIIMLKKYKRSHSIQYVMNHILSESEKHWGTHDVDTYINKLFTTIINNRLNLSKSFSRLNGEKWQDISRNISMFGEELDLGTMDPMDDGYYFKNPHSYLDHYKGNMHDIFIGFFHMIDSIEKNSNYKINHQQLAESIYQTLINWIINNQEDIKTLHIENNWSDWFNYNTFINILVEKLFHSFTNYLNTCEYQKIIRARIKEKLGR